MMYEFPKLTFAHKCEHCDCGNNFVALFDLISQTALLHISVESI